MVLRRLGIEIARSWSELSEAKVFRQAATAAAAVTGLAARGQAQRRRDDPKGWLPHRPDAVRLVFVGLLAVGLLGGSGLIGCRTAPITGRQQLVFLPESQEVSLGATAFQEVTTKEPLSTNTHYQEIVNRVGQRIAAVAERPDFQWEFRVIASATENAFCLPGGKVAVYEGILPVCQTEAGLAVVMSHEVAHALARHGGERISQGYVVELGKQAVSRVSGSYEESQREMILKGYGVASQYGFILPYSRKHESEADHIGIMLLAKAGYDPDEAPRFWQRFAALQQGNKPLEFLSTHPSDTRRAEDLAGLLPEAKKLYEAAPVKYGLGETLQIAPAAAPAAAAPTKLQASPTATSPAATPATSPAGGSVSTSASPFPGLPMPSWDPRQLLPPPMRSNAP
ncbi:MAG: M48 family metalloprotease [Pirellulaceae bacterium]